MVNAIGFRRRALSTVDSWGQSPPYDCGHAKSSSAVCSVPAPAPRRFSTLFSKTGLAFAAYLVYMYPDSLDGLQ